MGGVYAHKCNVNLSYKEGLGNVDKECICTIIPVSRPVTEKWEPFYKQRESIRLAEINM